MNFFRIAQWVAISVAALASIATIGIIAHGDLLAPAKILSLSGLEARIGYDFPEGTQLAAASYAGGWPQQLSAIVIVSRSQLDAMFDPTQTGQYPVVSRLIRNSDNFIGDEALPHWDPDSSTPLAAKTLGSDSASLRLQAHAADDELATVYVVWFIP